MNGRSRVIASIALDVVAIPRPGIGLNEARDKWLAANPQNKVLGDGGRKDPRLLVAHEKSQTVIYELVPELSPPGFTVEDSMRHMRNLGMDVRGQGSPSARGNPTVIVSEKV